MKMSLVRQQTILFSKKKKYTSNECINKFWDGRIKTEFVPISFGPESQTILAQLCAQFRQIPELNRCVNVTVGLPLNISDNGNMDAQSEPSGQITITFEGIDNLLLRLFQKLGQNISLKFSLTQFREFQNPDVSGEVSTAIKNWHETGVPIQKREYHLIRRPNNVMHSFYSTNGCCITKPLHNIPQSMINAWNNGKVFQGDLSVMLVYTNPFSLPESSMQVHNLSRHREMLENEICTDLFLESQDGSMVKCHKYMLLTGSGKLKMLLENVKFQHPVQLMNHFSLNCIKALLAYIYCRDVSKAVANHDIAIQTLEAALEFQVDGLTKEIQEFLMMQPSMRITLNDCVKIFWSLNSTQGGEKYRKSWNAKQGNGKVGCGDGNADEFENELNPNWYPVAILERCVIEVIKLYEQYGSGTDSSGSFYTRHIVPDNSILASNYPTIRASYYPNMTDYTFSY